MNEPKGARQISNFSAGRHNPFGIDPRGSAQKVEPSGGWANFLLDAEAIDLRNSKSTVSIVYERFQFLRVSNSLANTWPVPSTHGRLIFDTNVTFGGLSG